MTIIAGPCSVESREQLGEVATALAGVPQVKLIRAGVWKPRTRPGAFEGLGEVALGWMQELSAELDVAFCCEVARPEHIELCRTYGIHTVWIGARTTTNPFMVEEICSALKDGGMDVMVKNPVCPDVRLWIGAIERIEASGARCTAAIHRGFYLYNNQGYRNAPMWEVALELRRHRPDIPILCDPSHMGGQRELVGQLAATAMQLDYDGLMVETHPHPERAWSDGQQQITPSELLSLIGKLPSSQSSTASSRLSTLQPLRGQIDTVDHELLRLLAHRMDISRRIAHIKQQEGIPVYQSGRWNEVVADRLGMAEDLGLEATFTKEILERIHAESIRVQMDRTDGRK